MTIASNRSMHRNKHDDQGLFPGHDISFRSHRQVGAEAGTASTVRESSLVLLVRRIVYHRHIIRMVEQYLASVTRDGLGTDIVITMEL